MLAMAISPIRRPPVFDFLLFFYIHERNAAATTQRCPREVSADIFGEKSINVLIALAEYHPFVYCQGAGLSLSAPY